VRRVKKRVKGQVQLHFPYYLTFLAKYISGVVRVFLVNLSEPLVVNSDLPVHNFVTREEL
jgi:hypothetical protein